MLLNRNVSRALGPLACAVLVACGGAVVAPQEPTTPTESPEPLSTAEAPPAPVQFDLLECDHPLEWACFESTGLPAISTDGTTLALLTSYPGFIRMATYVPVTSIVLELRRVEDGSTVQEIGITSASQEESVMRDAQSDCCAEVGFDEPCDSDLCASDPVLQADIVAENRAAVVASVEEAAALLAQGSYRPLVPVPETDSDDNESGLVVSLEELGEEYEPLQGIAVEVREVGAEAPLLEARLEVPCNEDVDFRYTGSISAWVDPQTRVFVVLATLEEESEASGDACYLIEQLPQGTGR